MKTKIISTLILYLVLSLLVDGEVTGSRSVTIIDARHYSNVFSEMRNYRIFLPPGYYDNPEKKYPVIYFLHGWSQRFFGSGGNDYSGFEEGDDNKGDNIAGFVSSHDVIVVKSDGYNRNPDEKYYPRPYNIGGVETYRQFPLYFPELIKFIDNSYNTLADREHRAISGLSMGGFMTFWIGGKYPHLFSAAGSFCGSAEFIVGPRDFPVEYQHIDMYKNYGGMNIRLNYGNQDFIRGYHYDMNKVWTQVMDHYEYQVYNAEHSTCGISDMFGFFLKTFADPPQKPDKWSHIDVYPEFSVWDYNVTTDRNVPGFTILENVNKRGFRSSVREFVPDGELLSFVNVTVRTPPLYEKNQLYIINDMDIKSLKSVTKTIISDNSGCLKITMNGRIHEIGINRREGKPDICIASFEVVNMDWATTGKEVNLSIRLLNKGMSIGKNISARLSATKNNTDIVNNEVTFGNINSNEVQVCKVPYTFHLKSDSVEIVQFRLIIHDDNKNQWNENFEIPVKGEVPEIKEFVIADGKVVTVANSGIDSASIFLGNGNGDGIANPGESIVILIKNNNKYWRTNLYTSDKFINSNGTNMRFSDNWGNYDHVGGSAKYSIPLISSECPQNHDIAFFAEYWLPAYPLHIIKQGRVTVKINGLDKTPPKLEWVMIPGDNIIQAKLYDGSEIKTVKARLFLPGKPANYFDIELKDNGLDGDAVCSDNIFSTRIPKQKFGFYKVMIDATDSYGNNLNKEGIGEYLLH